MDQVVEGLYIKPTMNVSKTYVVVKQIKENVKGILESRAEADILKRLRHAYLPRIYDFLEIDGDIYTVIDYIPGESLDKLLKEQKAFPSEQVYRWALQLAEVLDYLHRQTPPVIHSDIKPAKYYAYSGGRYLSY